MNDTIVLTGYDLSIDEIVAIGRGEKKVSMEPRALQRCEASRKFLEEEISKQRVIYGVNTSFGPMCNKIIDHNHIETLQANLIRSHAAGLGEPLNPDVARAVFAVRLNTLVKGYAGVRIELLELLEGMINAGIAPWIPECGSVGASGDLVHLAHMALSIIGEGNVWFDDRVIPAELALKQCDLEPLNLSYKEGLALINGTAAMTAIAAFAIHDARKSIDIACLNAAFAIEIFGGIDDAFDRHLHAVKPHPGQVWIADRIRGLYKGSENITLRENMHEIIRSKQKGDEQVFETDINVQDVYSIRCTPQILAPVQEAIEFTSETVMREANSSNDNPIIIPEKRKIIHGGNFHGQSISFAMDMLAIAVSTMCNLSERRLNKLLDRNLNEGLPEHLIPGTVGLTMGFMGAQYLSTSTTAENRQMAAPVSTNTISCNASNQDVVSMGTVSARRTYRMLKNASYVLTMETLADMQALSFRNADKLGGKTGRIYGELQKHFRVYDNTRIFHEDLAAFKHLIFKEIDLSGMLEAKE